MDDAMVLEALKVLLDYTLQLLPGLGLFMCWFCLTPRAQAGMRIVILLLAFVFIRDLMTPCQLWALNGEPPIFFHSNPLVLISLGVASLMLIAGLPHLDAGLWSLVVAFKGHRLFGLLIGITAGCLVGLPLRLFQDIEPAAMPWLLGLAVLAFGGNALEEILFRGVLQGFLEQHTSAQRAAFGSATAFCACHGFLAYTLTHAGWPILMFTFIEGVVCAQVRLKSGTVPAIATHGTIIALLGVPLL